MAVFRKSVDVPSNTLPANTSNISNYAAGANAGNLILNGSYVEVDGTVNFIKKGYSSSVSITSAANISAITFTIYGINNGFYTTEVVTGPNATTVESNGFYEKIISISINNNIGNAFTIGSNRSTVVLVEFLNNNFTNLRPEFSCSITASSNAAIAASVMGIMGINSPGAVMLYRLYGGTSVITSVARPASFKNLSTAAIAVNALLSGVNYTSNSATLATMLYKIFYITSNVTTTTTNFTCIWTN